MVILNLFVFFFQDRDFMSRVLDVMDIIAMVSTLLAVYGTSVLYRVSAHALRDFHIRPKFLVMQVVLLLINFQGAIINFIYVYAVLPCHPPLNYLATGRREYLLLQEPIPVEKLLNSQ